ncbi:MAG: putative sulfate exporter family transporter [Paracoccaceae bacterium]|nr:putative sulfate exporter family transporter [Paracoccaceae bacterium]
MTTRMPSATEPFTDVPKRTLAGFPTIATAVIVAITAPFLADQSEAPAIFMTMLLGITVVALGNEGKTATGISFAARILQRIGIASPGARISMVLRRGHGVNLITLVASFLPATIRFGRLISRRFRHGWRFAFPAAGSVAICGASAAMAISAILSEDIVAWEKLVCVLILALIVLIAGLLFRTHGEATDDSERRPLLLVITISFLMLATLNSFGVIAVALADFMSQSSCWLLLVAILAVSMKTKFIRVLAVEGPAITLLITETLFIAGLILLGINYIS